MLTAKTFGGAVFMSLINKLTAKIPFKKHSESAQYFFALNIGLSEAYAGVWGIHNSRLDIIGQYSTTYQGTEDLIEKANLALDKALGAFEIEPAKILFGIPDSWTLDDNLKDPYSKLLQKMTEEYQLEPLAYVTTSHAISHLIQKQDGVPPTAVLLGIGDYVEVSLVRGGKVMDGRNTKRGERLFEDIEKVMMQFNEVEVLPSKILLYSTKSNQNTTKLKDELMSYPWMQKLSFLHFPKIEILEDDIALSAIILAGAVEISPDISWKQAVSDHPKVIDKPSLGLSRINRAAVSKPLDQDSKAGDGLGFVVGDIENQGQEAEDLEFKGQEFANPEDDSLVNLEAEPDHRLESSHPKFPESFETSHLARSFEDKPKFKVSLPDIPRLGLRLFTKLAILPVIFVILAVAYVFLVKAAVTVFVEPRILERDTEVIADPAVSQIDEDKKIIPASLVEATVTGSQKAAATGQKQIGDPARGKVLVYNLTTNKVSLPVGTVMSSPGGLKFTLDTSVQIASQSSQIGPDFTTIIKPGKSDLASSTASNIGPESNLAAGVELAVASYPKSQIVAKIDEAFSGGTSKTVSVVTSDDQKKLQLKVIDELKLKAEEDLKSKVSDGKKIVNQALDIVEDKYTFNKQVNDQATEFSVNATIKFKGTTYSDADLRTIVAKLVETNVPDGYELNLADAQTQADISKVEKDGKLIFKARFRAKLLPKFNIEDIKKKIHGQPVAKAAEVLRGLENVVGSEIKISPSLPANLSILPFLDQNITITILPK